MTRAREPEPFSYDEIETPLGRLTLVADGRGALHLVGWLEQHERIERALRRYSEGPGVALERVSDPHGLSSALRAYFDGDLAAIDGLPTAGVGTAFQQRVWLELRAIPCGQTRSYGEVARRIGHASAVRAVGLANGSNPVGIVVPCHRVIGANGTLTGYGGGLERKRWLLEHERATALLELPFAEASRAPRHSEAKTALPARS
jgi:methylated-DNA-[protein]-cysteine S-methyltransferase